LLFSIYIKTSEKARFIAKTGIVERKACGPLGICNNMHNVNLMSAQLMGFDPDKVFPEEVDNIKNFMHETFSTNLNAFSLSDSKKSKGEDNKESTNHAFLQGDEINSISQNSLEFQNRDLYFGNIPNRDLNGIDSSSLNKSYLKFNQRNRNISRNARIEEENNFSNDSDFGIRNEDNMDTSDYEERNRDNGNNENNTNYLKRINHNLTKEGNSSIRRILNKSDKIDNRSNLKRNMEDKSEEINILSKKKLNRQDTDKISFNQKYDKLNTFNKKSNDNTNEEMVNNHKMLQLK